jgi:glycosyltransferase involved in cell wall biosynthesis
MSVVGGITTWARHLLRYSDPRRVRFEVLDTAKRYEPLTRATSARGALMGAWMAIQRLFSVLAACRRLKPDVVYVTSGPTIGFVMRDLPLLFILTLLRIPHVIHLHGGNAKGFFGGPIRRRFVRAALKTCSAVLVLTRPLEKLASDVIGRDKVAYAPNMMADDQVPPPREREILDNDSRPANLLHVAWQTRFKGSLVLTEAVSHLRRPVRCDLVGASDPENEAAIKALIQRLNLGDSVVLAGEKHGDDLRRFWQAADLFVFPSFTEGFPNAILEAMMYGVPIISTDVGNIAEMIQAGTDNAAGLVLEKSDPPDPQEVARLIEELMAQPDLRRRMSLNGQARIRDYLASRVVPEMENMLLEVAAGGRCPAIHRWGRGRHDQEQALQAIK